MPDINLLKTNPELAFRQFESNLDKITEEFRVLKERSDFCYKKISDCESQQATVIARLKVHIAEFNYSKTLDDINQLLILIERHELPATKILYSVIYNHAANLGSLIKSDANVEQAPAIYKEHTLILNLLNIKIAALNAEIADIKLCIQKELPLKTLEQLSKDELQDLAVDRQMQDVNSRILHTVHKLENETLTVLAKLSDEFTEFEKRHKGVQITAQISQEYFDKVIKLNGTYKQMVLILSLVGCAVPPLAPAAGFLSIFSGASNQISKTKAIVGLIKDVNTKVARVHNIVNASNNLMAA